MAATRRQQTTAVIDDLYANPAAYEFHQAVRILRAVQGTGLGQEEETFGAESRLQFSSRIQLTYPSSDLFAVTQLESGITKVEVNFMGLAGTTGPLPIAYTERFIERERAKDTAPRAFLDLFNHRLIGLMHTIRVHQWPTLAPCSPEKSRLAVPLKSFVGLNGRHLQNRLKIADRSLYAFSGVLWHHPRSAAGLRQILRVHFQVNVTIEPCQGGWRPINDHLLTTLGGEVARLGWGASIGSRFWDQGKSIKVILGPLSLAQFKDFLPTGSAYVPLAELGRFYLGYQTRVEAELVLKQDEVPQSYLARDTRLGWTSWLLSNSAKSNGHARVRILDDVQKAYDNDL